MKFQLSRVDKYLAFIAAASMVVATTLLLLVGLGAEAADYESGDKFATIDGVVPSQAASTLVVFLNTNCGACRRSAEVIRRLAQRPRAFRLAVVGYEDEAIMRQFTATFAIDADVITSMPVSSIRFAAVPRLALVDRSGIVSRVWAGAPEITSSETAILDAARALAVGRR